MSKYHSRKITVDGMKFDSKGEYCRWCELVLLQRAGEISELRRQRDYVLIPTQYINGKVAERAVKYVADFTYMENGQLVVEDYKGYETPEYIIKRKLMLFIHGIKVKEIRNAKQKKNSYGYPNKRQAVKK